MLLLQRMVITLRNPFSAVFALSMARMMQNNFLCKSNSIHTALIPNKKYRNAYWGKWGLLCIQKISLNHSALMWIYSHTLRILKIYCKWNYSYTCCEPLIKNLCTAINYFWKSVFWEDVWFFLQICESQEGVRNFFSIFSWDTKILSLIFMGTEFFWHLKISLHPDIWH